MSEKRPIKCFVRESPSNKDLFERSSHIPPKFHSMLQKGWGNGYAIIPPGHPYYRTPFSEIPVQVHGPLTFGKLCKDCNWAEIAEEDKDGYVVGFDCWHGDDNPENCPKEFVENKARELAAILESMW